MKNAEWCDKTDTGTLSAAVKLWTWPQFFVQTAGGPGHIRPGSRIGVSGTKGRFHDRHMCRSRLLAQMHWELRILHRQEPADRVSQHHWWSQETVSENEGHRLQRLQGIRDFHWPLSQYMKSRHCRYNTEVLASGGFKGHCTVKNGVLKRFMKRGTTLHPLQSWAPEIRYLEQASKDTKSCDHVVNKPTILMKPDLTSNMYHHFCDFFNLYASLALNGTVFSQDKKLIMPPRSVQAKMDRIYKMWIEWDISVISYHLLIKPGHERHILGVQISKMRNMRVNSRSIIGIGVAVPQLRSVTRIETVNK